MDVVRKIHCRTTWQVIGSFAAVAFFPFELQQAGLTKDPVLASIRLMDVWLEGIAMNEVDRDVCIPKVCIES
jgi:hypothetical protein